jgi:hypothetical protein
MTKRKNKEIETEERSGVSVAALAQRLFLVRRVGARRLAARLILPLAVHPAALLAAHLAAHRAAQLAVLRVETVSTGRAADFFGCLHLFLCDAREVHQHTHPKQRDKQKR